MFARPLLRWGKAGSGALKAGALRGEGLARMVDTPMELGTPLPSPVSRLDDF